MADLEEIWTEAEDAVGEALNNGEGRASAWYLEHHFNKAGLGIYRLPDHPLTELEERLLAVRTALDEADGTSLGKIGKLLDTMTENVDLAINAAKSLRVAR